MAFTSPQHTDLTLASMVSNGVLSWRLRKNCSITPLQLLGLYVSISSVSIFIAVFFWSIGAFLVLPFACLEVVFLGCAFWWYARHAIDGETVFCDDNSLIIDTNYSGQSKRYVFLKHTVHVYQTHKNGLIEIRSQGQKVEIGQFLHVGLRPLLVSELKKTLLQT